MMCDNESYWKAGIELMTNADPQETQHSDLLMPTRSLSITQPYTLSFHNVMSDSDPTVTL